MNRQHFKSIQTRKNPNPTFQPHLQSHSCYHMNVHCLTMRNLISPCWCYSRNFIIDVCLCHHKRVWEPLVKVGLAADGKPLADGWWWHGHHAGAGQGRAGLALWRWAGLAMRHWAAVNTGTWAAARNRRPGQFGCGWEPCFFGGDTL